MATKIGNLSKEILNALDDYTLEVGLEVERTIDEVAKDTAEELKKISPKLTGDYAESWICSKGESKRTKYTTFVHAEKPEYTLTHLLENPHQTRNGDKTEGYPHISVAEKKAVRELEDKLKDRL